MRWLIGVPRWQSARNMFLILRIRSFEEILRYASFSCQKIVCEIVNSLICVLVDVDAASYYRIRNNWFSIMYLQLSCFLCDFFYMVLSWNKDYHYLYLQCSNFKNSKHSKNHLSRPSKNKSWDFCFTYKQTSSLIRKDDVYFFSVFNRRVLVLKFVSVFKFFRLTH